MSQEFSDTLQGLSIDEPSEDRSRDDADDEEEYERFVVIELGERRLAVPVDTVGTTTDVPASVTRVPRSPDAIEGVTDLRGDITAVIEPRTHFPTRDAPADDQDLLVFDRPSDRQSAGIRVDAVLGVESVPTSDVFREDVDEADLLEYGVDAESIVDRVSHPLVAGVVLTRQQPTIAAEDVVGGVGGAGEEESGATAGIETGTETGAGTGIDTGGLLENDDDVGTPFELEDDESESESEEEPEEEVVYEAMTLVDVERMLLAAGTPD